MDKDIIGAIGELWKLGAVCLLTFVIVYFRKEIRTVIAKMNKVQVKSGEKELTISGDNGARTEEDQIRLGVSETSAGMQSKEEVTSQPHSSPDYGFWDAYFEKDKDKLKTAYERMQTDEANAISRIRNEVLYYWFSYSLGEVSALDNLKTVLKTSEGTEAYPLVISAIGSCYEKGNVFDKALQLYDEALAKLTSSQDVAQIIVNKANCLYKMGMKYRIDACDLIKEKLETIIDIEAKFTLYTGLANLYKQSEEWLSQALVLEQALAIHSDNSDLRFEIAYAYGKTEFTDLSILHYRILLRFQPDHDLGLNNIGVEYNKEEMPIMSIESYKKAQEQNNTLASSNLAYKLLDVGFVDEAKAILDEAMNQNKPHENVATALAEIIRRREQEVKKEKEMISIATEKQRLILPFSSCYLVKRANISFGGTWTTEQGIEVVIETLNNQIDAIWEEGGEKYKLNGIITNDSAIVTMTFVATPLTLLGYKEPLKGFAYLTNDGQNLEIILFNKSTITKKWNKKGNIASNDCEA